MSADRSLPADIAGNGGAQHSNGEDDPDLVPYSPEQFPEVDLYGFFHEVLIRFQSSVPQLKRKILTKQVHYIRDVPAFQENLWGEAGNELQSSMWVLSY